MTSVLLALGAPSASGPVRHIAGFAGPAPPATATATVRAPAGVLVHVALGACGASVAVHTAANAAIPSRHARVAVAAAAAAALAYVRSPVAAAAAAALAAVPSPVAAAAATAARIAATIRMAAGPATATATATAAVAAAAAGEDPHPTTMLMFARRAGGFVRPAAEAAQPVRFAPDAWR